MNQHHKMDEEATKYRMPEENVSDRNRKDNPLDDTTVADLNKSLQRLGNDRALLREFIFIYSEDAPGLLERILNAVDARDVYVVEYAARRLQGLAANFEARRVVATAQNLQDFAKAKNLHQATPIVSELKQRVTELNELLRKSLQADFSN